MSRLLTILAACLLIVFHLAWAVKLAPFLSSLSPSLFIYNLFSVLDWVSFQCSAIVFHDTAEEHLYFGKKKEIISNVSHYSLSF